MSEPWDRERSRPPLCGGGAVRDRSRRRRGCDADIPWRRVAGAASRAPVRPRRRLAAPKTKKSKAKKQDDEGGGRDGSYDFFKAVIDAPRRRRPRLGEDEAARNFETGRTYNKLTRAKHCAFEARLQMKLDLQQAAVPPAREPTRMSPRCRQRVQEHTRFALRRHDVWFPPRSPRCRPTSGSAPRASRACRCRRSTGGSGL